MLLRRLLRERFSASASASSDHRIMRVLAPLLAPGPETMRLRLRFHAPRRSFLFVRQLRPHLQRLYGAAVDVDRLRGAGSGNRRDRVAAPISACGRALMGDGRLMAFVICWRSGQRALARDQ